MITVKDSFKKGAALFCLVLLGVIDFIATMNNVAVARTNGAIISVGLIATAVWLFIKWSKDSETKNK